MTGIVSPTDSVRLGKELYIPEKTYTRARDFVNDFPHLKTALVVLAVDKYYRKQVGKSVRNTSTFDFVQQETYTFDPPYSYRDKLLTYEDMVTYAASNERAADFTFDIPDDLGGFTRHYAGRYWFWKTSLALWWTEFVLEEYGDFKPDRVTTGTFLFTGSRTMAYASYKMNKGQLFDMVIDSLFPYFRYRTPRQYVTFNEVYGISRIEDVPKNTISYAVTGQDVPISDEYKTRTVEFWSSLFTHIPLGKNILESAARHLPVSIKTEVTAWSNPDEMQNTVERTETDREFITEYIYAFQDFRVTVGAKYNILVEYNRGVDSVTIVQRKASGFKKAIKKYLPIVAIGIIAVAGAGALLTATGVIGGGTGGTVAAGSTVAEGTTGVLSVGGSAVGTVSGGAATAGGAIAGTSGAVAAGGGGLTAILSGFSGVAKAAGAALSVATGYETYENVKEAGEQPAPVQVQAAPGDKGQKTTLAIGGLLLGIYLLA